MMGELILDRWLTGDFSDPDPECYLRGADIDNCATMRILRGEFRHPLWPKSDDDDHPPNIINWNEIFNINQPQNSKRFVPCIRPPPPYPKISALSRRQHLAILRIMSEENPNVLEELSLGRPTKQDFKTYKSIQKTYLNEQKAYKEWAKSLWPTDHCIRTLRPEPIVERVYEAEFKMRAQRMQALPKHYDIAALITLENCSSNCRAVLEQELIKVTLAEMPQVQIPEKMEQHFNIINKRCMVPQPCQKHPYQIVLPNEEALSIEPITEVHRELAAFAANNNTQYIVSENALKCLTHWERHWLLPLSICDTLGPEGNRINVVVLDSEFSVRKEGASMRTYKAFRHLLEQALIPATRRQRIRGRKSTAIEEKILSPTPPKLNVSAKPSVQDVDVTSDDNDADYRLFIDIGEDEEMTEPEFLGFGSTGANSGTLKAGLCSPKAKFGTPKANFGTPDLSLQSPEASFESPKSDFATPKAGSCSPQAGFASSSEGFVTPYTTFGSTGADFGTHKADLRSPKAWFESPKANFGIPQGCLLSTEVGFVSPKSDFGTLKAVLRSPEVVFKSPKSDFTTPKAGVCSPEARFVAPTASFISPHTTFGSIGSDFGTIKAGLRSTKAWFESPKANFSTPNAGLRPPEAGLKSPKSDFATPKAGVCSPEAKFVAPSAGFVSPHTSFGSPNVFIFGSPQAKQSVREGTKSIPHSFSQLSCQDSTRSLTKAASSMISEECLKVPECGLHSCTRQGKDGEVTEPEFLGFGSTGADFGTLKVGFESPKAGLRSPEPGLVSLSAGIVSPHTSYGSPRSDQRVREETESIPPSFSQLSCEESTGRLTNSASGTNSEEYRKEPRFGLYSCTCQDTLFAMPPRRSFKKWQFIKKETNEKLDIIIHSPHKAKDKEGELILEPLPEYQLDLGASEQSPDAVRSAALSLALRQNGSLLNVRIDGGTGDVATFEKLSSKTFSKRHPDATQQAVNTIYSALSQLQDLNPGHYVLQHEPRYGSNAMLMCPRSARERITLRLNFECGQLIADDEALVAKLPPTISTALLPYHKFRRVVPCAFTSFEHMVVKRNKKSKAKRKVPQKALKMQTEQQNNAPRRKLLRRKGKKK